MTVAICCITPEGIVLGADSTASFMVPGNGFHYLNHNQKIFELGCESTLGMATWGLASLDGLSHRTQFAKFSDYLKVNPKSSVLEVAESWVDFFWESFLPYIAPIMPRLEGLHAKQPNDPLQEQSETHRTKEEEEIYLQLSQGLVVGFCLAGYQITDRAPYAYEMVFDPLSGKPTPVAIHGTRCWGAPRIFDRLIRGIDPEITRAIMESGKWSGTVSELIEIANSHTLYIHHMPIRDAVDFVYSCVSSTIKSLKFSSLSQICGGPIEIAVITTDRPFRWVRHKEWDAAIREGHTR
jgi:hypothetical protein